MNRQSLRLVVISATAALLIGAILISNAAAQTRAAADTLSLGIVSEIRHKEIEERYRDFVRYAARKLSSGSEVEGKVGRRSIPAREFFVDILTTALQPDEILTEIRVPVFAAHTGSAYEKFPNPASRYAIVGAAATGVGNVFGSFLQGALRNPAAADSQQGRLFIGFAAAELLGLSDHSFQHRRKAGRPRAGCAQRQRVAPGYPLQCRVAAHHAHPLRPVRYRCKTLGFRTPYCLVESAPNQP